eukprot:GDKJ01017116.1.p1 GENE.GDKJ01017116.1~~GDKJ01017116.1.p1  ORF type:complete len:114 (+),score=22.61 GDKJ01017116.1:24-365(+)
MSGPPPNNNDDIKEVQYKTLLGARVRLPVDMPGNMVEDAILTAQEALRECDGDDQQIDGVSVCKKIKQVFDEKYGCYWHVVCGKSFGCHAIHETRRFLYFTLAPYTFMIYKAQ